MPRYTLRTQDSSSELEVLVEMHEGALLGYAHRMLGNREAAQDVVQETFLKYVEKPLRFGEPRQWASWLFRVTHNRCLDKLKQQSRRRELNLKILPPGNVRTPNEAVVAEELKTQLRALMGELSTNQRSVLTLFFQENKSYREIADITGLSMSNVGMSLQRGLKKMRKLAEKENIGLVR